MPSDFWCRPGRTNGSSPLKLEVLQVKWHRVMIKHAYDNTEFYHRNFRNVGIRPEDIRTVDDLKKIPFTPRMNF